MRFLVKSCITISLIYGYCNTHCFSTLGYSEESNAHSRVARVLAAGESDVAIVRASCLARKASRAERLADVPCGVCVQFGSSSTVVRVLHSIAVLQVFETNLFALSSKDTLTALRRYLGRLWVASVRCGLVAGPWRVGWRRRAASCSHCAAARDWRTSAAWTCGSVCRHDRARAPICGVLVRTHWCSGPSQGACTSTTHGNEQ
ncbi:hypothetical protein BC834DRAFT_858061 [Gloeopeniophorella convolvens]|nr:hypothetical protein BC834DRAFT_858061 [Gloeopeniophorella convolvens]